MFHMNLHYDILLYYIETDCKIEALFTDSVGTLLTGYAKGSGTETNPYRIETVEELYTLSQQVAKVVKQPIPLLVVDILQFCSFVLMVDILKRLFFQQILHYF